MNYEVPFLFEVHCNFPLIRFVNYKLCAKIYLFRPSQSVVAFLVVSGHFIKLF